MGNSVSLSSPSRRNATQKRRKKCVKNTKKITESCDESVNKAKVSGAENNKKVVESGEDNADKVGEFCDENFERAEVFNDKNVTKCLKSSNESDDNEIEESVDDNYNKSVEYGNEAGNTIKDSGDKNVDKVEESGDENGKNFELSSDKSVPEVDGIPAVCRRNNNVDTIVEMEVNIAVQNANTNVSDQYILLELSDIEETLNAFKMSSLATDQDHCTEIRMPKRLSDICIEAIAISECLYAEDPLLPELKDDSFVTNASLNNPLTMLQQSRSSQWSIHGLHESSEDDSYQIQQLLSMFYSIAISRGIKNPFPYIPNEYLSMVNQINGNHINDNSIYLLSDHHDYDVDKVVDNIIGLLDDYEQENEREITYQQLDEDSCERMFPDFMSSDWKTTSLRPLYQYLYKGGDDVTIGLTADSKISASVNASIELPWSRAGIMDFLKSGDSLCNFNEFPLANFFTNNLYNSADEFPCLTKYPRLSGQGQVCLKPLTWSPADSHLCSHHHLPTLDYQKTMANGCHVLEPQGFVGIRRKGMKYREKGKLRKKKRKQDTKFRSMNEGKIIKLDGLINSPCDIGETEESSICEKAYNKWSIFNDSESSICLLGNDSMSLFSNSLPDSSAYESEDFCSDELSLPIEKIRRFPGSCEEAALAVSEVRSYFLMRSCSQKVKRMPTDCPLNMQPCISSKIYTEAENTPSLNIEMISKPPGTMPLPGLTPAFDSMIKHNLADSNNLRSGVFEDVMFEGQIIPIEDVPAHILYYMELGVVPWKWKTRLSFSKVISDSFIPIEVRNAYIQNFGWCPSSYDKLYCFEGHSKYLFSYKLLGCWECMRKHFNCLYKWFSHSKLINCGSSQSTG